MTNKYVIYTNNYITLIRFKLNNGTDELRAWTKHNRSLSPVRGRAIITDPV